jgi:predicted nucleotidyltransferase
MSEPLRLRKLLERLTEAEVRFVLVGGLAVNAWGYLRATRDIDVVPEQGADNLANLDSVLATLDAEAVDVDMDGLIVRVCSLEHLLAMKRVSERPRDRDDLEALEAAQAEAGKED